METPEQPQKPVTQPAAAPQSAASQPVAPQPTVPQSTAPQSAVLKPATPQQPVASSSPATYSMPTASSSATGERSPATGKSPGSVVKKIMTSVIVVAVLGGGVALGYFVFPETFYSMIGKYAGMSAPGGIEEVSGNAGEEDATAADENENAESGPASEPGSEELESWLEPESGSEPDAGPGQEDKSNQPLTETEQTEYQRIFDEQERQLNEGEPSEPAELESQVAEPSSGESNATPSRPKIRRPQAQ